MREAFLGPGGDRHLYLRMAARGFCPVLTAALHSSLKLLVPGQDIVTIEGDRLWVLRTAETAQFKPPKSPLFKSFNPLETHMF